MDTLSNQLLANIAKYLKPEISIKVIHIPITIIEYNSSKIIMDISGGIQTKVIISFETFKLNFKEFRSIQCQHYCKIQTQRLDWFKDYTDLGIFLHSMTEYKTCKESENVFANQEFKINEKQITIKNYNIGVASLNIKMDIDKSVYIDYLKQFEKSHR